MSGPKAPPGFVSCTKAEFGSKGNSPSPGDSPELRPIIQEKRSQDQDLFEVTNSTPSPSFGPHLEPFLLRMGLEWPRIPAGPGATDKSNPKKLWEGLNAEFSSRSIPDFQQDKPVTMKPFVPPQRDGHDVPNLGKVLRVRTQGTSHACPFQREPRSRIKEAQEELWPERSLPGECCGRRSCPT